MDKPFGQWNQFKIRMVGDRVKVVFNGQTVVDNAVLENYFARKDFEAAKKAGKITDPNAFPDPAFPRGPIQLQTHGSEIRWRNLFIREIPAEEANRILADGNKGFTRLDNGKDLKGWQGAVENYEVVDGAIVGKPGKGGTSYPKGIWRSGDAVRIQTALGRKQRDRAAHAAKRPPGLGRFGNPSDRQSRIQRRSSQGPAQGLSASRFHLPLPGSQRRVPSPVGQWNCEEITVKDQRITCGRQWLQDPGTPISPRSTGPR